jgi:hypothetical protein
MNQGELMKQQYDEIFYESTKGYKSDIISTFKSKIAEFENKIIELPKEKNRPAYINLLMRKIGEYGSNKTIYSNKQNTKFQNYGLSLINKKDDIYLGGSQPNKQDSKLIISFEMCNKFVEDVDNTDNITEIKELYDNLFKNSRDIFSNELYTNYFLDKITEAFKDYFEKTEYSFMDKIYLMAKLNVIVNRKVSNFVITESVQLVIQLLNMFMEKIKDDYLDSSLGIPTAELFENIQNFITDKENKDTSRIINRITSIFKIQGFNPISLRFESSPSRKIIIQDINNLLSQYSAL